MLLPLEAVQQSSSFSVVERHGKSWVELAIGTGTLAVAGSLPALHLALQTFSSGSQHRRLVAEPIGASRSCACCTRRVAHWPCVPGLGPDLSQTARGIQYLSTYLLLLETPKKNEGGSFEGFFGL